MSGPADVHAEPGAVRDPGAEFAPTLAERLDSYGARPFVEFERRWYTGDDLAAIARATEDALARAGVGPGEAVGVTVRNRVPHAAVVLGAVARRRPLVMINSYRSAGAIAREVAELGLAAIVAGERDWTAELRAACAAAGSAGVAAEIGRTVCARRGATATAAAPGPHIPSGGTTSPPQRVALGTAASGLHIPSGGTTGPPDPAVRDACVVGVPDLRLGQVPFAAVELRGGHTAPAPAELLALVREELPSHHIPVDVAVLPELPRNAAMKVRTDAVAALYGDRG
ncbi:AMP-binding protein [Nocardia sp. NPDC050697]|uniref:AMP-binding enzyme n=1 Tax=Nocardia sp. NPDC050697 TaxID=3155158 RepID=UPI0033F58306